MLAKALQGASTAAEKIYIESVFSTFLYTGNSSTQTITNGIDLSGKGGLVWIKGRSVAYSNYLTDTVRGPNKNLFSDSTLAEQNDTNSITAFNSNGWSMDAESGINASSQTYASWTFREAAKFFDVVTYTGNATNRTIAHDLGSTPGCIIIKRTNAGGNWFVYHRGLSNPALDFINLNTTSAASTNFSAYWNSTAPTSTVFSLGTEADINANGGTYVAYLFAHDAGGFGTSGNESVIKCGSFTTDGSGNATVDLGWEPQWVMMKTSSTTGSWNMLDTMRGYTAASGASTYNLLYANSSSTEASGAGDYGGVTSTGFTAKSLSASATYIYIAIRRGPMKTPTDATKVFSAVARTGTGANATINVGFAPDFATSACRTSGEYMPVVDKLRGPTNWLTWQQLMTNAESGADPTMWFLSFTNTGVTVGPDNSGGVSVNSLNRSLIQYYFRRAPGFFDVVAYTGTGSARTVNHNLGVAPELMIVKGRSAGVPSSNWLVYCSAVSTPATSIIYLNYNDPRYTGAIFWNSTDPTSTVFSIGSSGSINGSTYNYIAYLFATCPGVSKCFNYTGTGTTLQINCGFTNGARFVMIKRTDSAGDWYVWDSARGIISGNDPYLLLNSTAAEVTNTDYIDPYSAGFEISSTAPAAINANGGSYIGLAIA